MVAMALNDHFLKFAYPSWVTGKLSDFLGVFFFPLFLSALVVLMARVQFTRSTLSVAMLVTVLMMVATKLDPAVSKWIETEFSTFVFKIKLTPDFSDLIALPVSLPLCYLFSRPYFQKTA